jgi:hypothetical protein
LPQPASALRDLKPLPNKAAWALLRRWRAMARFAGFLIKALIGRVAVAFGDALRWDVLKRVI